MPWERLCTRESLIIWSPRSTLPSLEEAEVATEEVMEEAAWTEAVACPVAEVRQEVEVHPEEAVVVRQEEAEVPLVACPVVEVRQEVVAFPWEEMPRPVGVVHRP